MLTSANIRALRTTLRDDDNRLSNVFAALGDPTRLGIFRLLLARRDVCVSDVASILGVSVSAASQQLKTLELTGLAHRERNGQMICYRIRDDDPVVRSLKTLVIRAR